MLLTCLYTALLLIHILVGTVAQDAADDPSYLMKYEVIANDPDPANRIVEAVASEFDRHVPILSDNLRGELNGMRNDLNRQFESLKHYMSDKLDRMERDAPSSEPSSERPILGPVSAAQSPEAMIRHNLAMAELRRLGADLTRAMNAEVGKLREEFRTSLDSLREQVENSTDGMATRLQGEFTVRAEESVNMLKKVFFLTRSQMALIQSQLSNISTALNFPDLKSVSDDTDTIEVTTLHPEPEEVSEITPTSRTISVDSVTPSTTTTTTTTTTVSTTTLLPADLPRDCSEARTKGNTRSGITTIKPSEDQDSQEVWCDQETEGGGWTVMLRRQPQTNQLDFKKSWASYREGFGDPVGEYWIGLETLHRLTKDAAYSLRVDMRWEDEDATSLYSYFSVGQELYGYRGYELQVGEYNDSSTGGDSMEYHNGMDFSTYDQDNDGAAGGSCADWCGGGGWWYNYCFYSNPTGIFAPEDLPPNSQADHFLEWRKWQGYYTYLSHLFLMIRPN